MRIILISPSSLVTTIIKLVNGIGEMKMNNKKGTLKRSLLALLISTTIAAPCAYASTVSVALPEQSLADSLSAIAKQGQVQILFDANSVKNLRAPALSGQFETQTALQKVLIGSGLEIIPQGSGFVIRPLATTNAIVIPEVRVTGVGNAYHPATDVVSAPQYITAEEIKQRNTGDGNVTDLLKSNPAVQFSNNDSTSMNQGEIKPSRISIHGSSSYQNSYKLDGVSFNNDFDPAKSDLGETNTRISSDEQGMYLDSRLIDSVAVYDNNIPVEFGGFTGGTVEVQSRRWSGETHANAYYRTTRSSWNNIFTDPKLNFDTANNDFSNPARFQKKYNKQNFGGWFETSLTDNTGLIFSASRRESTIPMMISSEGGVIRHPDGELEQVEQTPHYKDQTRTSDNYFIKYSWDISEKQTFDLSSNIARYKSYLFSGSVYNSGYDNEHNGLSFTALYKHQLDLGSLELTAGYQNLEDKRSNDQDEFVTIKDYTDWKNPQQISSGGQGDLKSKQETYNAKSIMRFNPVEWGAVSHQPTTGFEISRTKGSYIRDKTYYNYTYTGSTWDDQWMGSLEQTTRFLAGTHDASYTNYSIYLDDNIQYKRLTLRPGIRLDRDDFVQKNNIAPRLSGTYDIWGTGNTLIIGGVNRYYGRSMLTYALYGAQNAGLQHCYYSCDNDNPNDWENRTDFEGVDSLKTPYNDEITLGLQQEIASTTWRLQYVHREGRDEVRSDTKYPNDKDKIRIRQFNNNGRSTHDTVTLSVKNSQPWELAQADHVFNASISWQQSKTNTPKDSGYANFDPSVQGMNYDKVWYDGKIINAKDLPSGNFNSPLKITAELTSVWDDLDVTWYNRLQWNGARSQAEKANNGSPKPSEYGPLFEYKKRNYSSRFTWDTKLGWKPEFAYGVGISVEVNNVLNTKNVSDYFTYQDKDYKSYEPGRQFWLQVSYDY